MGVGDGGMHLAVVKVVRVVLSVEVGGVGAACCGSQGRMVDVEEANDVYTILQMVDGCPGIYSAHSEARCDVSSPGLE